MIDSRGWLTTASHHPSPNFNERPEQTEISLLVIHNISLPPENFGGDWISDFFCNQLDPTADPYFETIAGLQVSSHLLIRRTGEIIQFVSFDKRAWHAGKSIFNNRENCNDFSIGVELEGSDNQPFEAVQYQCLSDISQTLMQHYPDITPENIAGHSDIAPGRKTDPGPFFEWDYFRSLLK